MYILYTFIYYPFYNTFCSLNNCVNNGNFVIYTIINKHDLYILICQCNDFYLVLSSTILSPQHQNRVALPHLSPVFLLYQDRLDCVLVSLMWGSGSIMQLHAVLNDADFS